MSYVGSQRTRAGSGAPHAEDSVGRASHTEDSVERACQGVGERLRERQAEIEEALYLRVRSIAGAVRDEDVEYQAGLRMAVGEVVDYCLTGIERRGDWLVPVPSAAVSQARRAARSDVSIDTLILRYIAGHRLLGEFVMDEVDRSDLSNDGSALRHLRRAQEALFERLTAAIVNEYNEERARATRSPEHHRRELVQKLLAGESVDTAGLGYELGAWHLGVVAMGVGAEKTLEDLALALDCELLLVVCGEGVLWAWLGARHRLAMADVERRLKLGGAMKASLTVGEPARGIAGWRLTHQEAQAAQLVALHKPQPLTRCSDVLLEAAVLRHEGLTRSLIRNYLVPLDGLRIGGQKARETLDAYFACDRNVSATAHLLGVARNTVESRLRDIEGGLGRTLSACLAELEVALRLESFSGTAAKTRGHSAFPSI